LPDTPRLTLTPCSDFKEFLIAILGFTKEKIDPIVSFLNIDSVERYLDAFSNDLENG
jgi:hypothetical protein